MTITYMDICKGGGGATLGAIAAGLTPLLGIEKDPVIAWYGGENTRFHNSDHKVLIGDVCNVDFSLLESPDWLHASPPCVNASRANNGNETSEDMELAEAICRAIAILKPRYFSLENVAGYVNFQSFDLIFKTVAKQYRYLSKIILNCADFGIPQSRKRLFLVASNSDFHLFQKLHLKKQKPVGWHEAIADLIPTLPECKLTKSQIYVLGRCDDVDYGCLEILSVDPDDFVDLAIQNSGSRKDKNGNPTNTIQLANEPIWTLRAMSGKVRVNPHQVTLIIDGKVLRPTIECYARWQTFPDSYQWPADFKLAMKICGNAVPPLMMKQIIEAVIHA